MTAQHAQKQQLKGYQKAYGLAQSAIINLQVKHFTQDKNKMGSYMCLDCQKEIKFELVKKRVRCPFCGSKILYKPRVNSATIEAV